MTPFSTPLLEARLYEGYVQLARPIRRFLKLQTTYKTQLSLKMLITKRSVSYITQAIDGFKLRAAELMRN